MRLVVTMSLHRSQMRVVIDDFLVPLVINVSLMSSLQSLSMSLMVMVMDNSNDLAILIIGKFEVLGLTVGDFNRVFFVNRGRLYRSRFSSRSGLNRNWRRLWSRCGSRSGSGRRRGRWLDWYRLWSGCRSWSWSRCGGWSGSRGGSWFYRCRLRCRRLLWFFRLWVNAESMGHKLVCTDNIVLHLTSSMVGIFREVSVTRVIILLWCVGLSDVVCPMVVGILVVVLASVFIKVVVVRVTHWVIKVEQVVPVEVFQMALFSMGYLFHQVAIIVIMVVVPSVAVTLFSWELMLLLHRLRMHNNLRLHNDHWSLLWLLNNLRLLFMDNSWLLWCFMLLLLMLRLLLVVLFRFLCVVLLVWFLLILFLTLLASFLPALVLSNDPPIFTLFLGV